MRKENSVQILRQMNGGILESFSVSHAEYVDVNCGKLPRSESEACLIFNLGTLVIGNRHKILSQYKENLEIEKLVGSRVESVNESTESITITFSCGSSVIVSLRDEDWNSPEAMSYSPKQGNIVVIN